MAQQAIDVWIAEYNTDRPHQSLGRCTPAERFAARTPDTGPTLELSALARAERHTGEDWISRRVASNGIISVTSQPFSVGKHHSGEIVDVHVTDRLLEVWVGQRADQDHRPDFAEGGTQEAGGTSPIRTSHEASRLHPRRIGQPSTETGQPHRTSTTGAVAPTVRAGAPRLVPLDRPRRCVARVRRPGLAERSLRRRYPAPVTAAAP